MKKSGRAAIIKLRHFRYGLFLIVGVGLLKFLSNLIGMIFVIEKEIYSAYHNNRLHYLGRGGSSHSHRSRRGTFDEIWQQHEQPTNPLYHHNQQEQQQQNEEDKPNSTILLSKSSSKSHNNDNNNDDNSEASGRQQKQYNQNPVGSSSSQQEQEQQQDNNLLSVEQKRRQEQLLFSSNNKTDSSSSSSSISNGAFIHMGKTGGSSLSLLLRNGCHSFQPKPCRNVTKETIVSQLVRAYYHVPDFGLLAKQQRKHSFYIITLRDPLDRFVSSFVYEHIDNEIARSGGEDAQHNPFRQEAKGWAYRKCFPTLEEYAALVGTDFASYSYPYHQHDIVTTNCTNLARAMITGRVRKFNHFFFTYRKIHSFLYDGEDSNNNDSDNNTIVLYATRQEHLLDDWKEINRLLLIRKQRQQQQEQQQEQHSYPLLGELTIPEARNSSRIYQPVTRQLSTDGQRIMCHALRAEYQTYFFFLARAQNINEEDLRTTYQQSKRNCPDAIDATLLS